MSTPGRTPDRPAPPRRRHLMDPNAPRPLASSGGMSISHVQRWVMSVLAVTTIGHLVAALVIGAVLIDPAHPESRVGLVVIAGAFGVLAVAVARMIHQRSPVTPWLLLGLLPTVVGLALVL